MPIIYFLLSLTTLYLTRTWLTREISRLVHHLGGNRRSTIIFWSIIFLPGTVIHEISHFLIAALTGARTGKIEIFPEFIEDNENDGGVALGSVQTQKLNPIQGFLIGLAPFFSGLGLLIWLSQPIQDSFFTKDYFNFAIYLYLFFVIANSFFPSWADIRQTLPLVALFISTVVIFSLIGISLNFQISTNTQNFIKNFSQIIFASSIVNIIVYLFLAGLKRVLYWIYE